MVYPSTFNTAYHPQAALWQQSQWPASQPAWSATRSYYAPDPSIQVARPSYATPRQAIPAFPPAGYYPSYPNIPTQVPTPTATSAPTHPTQQAVEIAEKPLNRNFKKPSSRRLPKPLKEQSLGVTQRLLHPFRSKRLKTHLSQNPLRGESFGIRLAMYNELRGALSKTGRKHLDNLLTKGKLTDNKSDDGGSTLRHLYSILRTPRAQGLKAEDILEHTLRLLNEPQTITQKFGALSPANLQQLTQYYNSGKGPSLAEKIDLNTLKVVSSATCVSSSVMYYMFDKHPSESVRHIAGLTSPKHAFYEKALPQEISPEDPSLADQVLDEYGIDAIKTPGRQGHEYWIRVHVADSGFIRVRDQQESHERKTRSPVEAAYQAALTKLVVPSYDPGLDMRINPDGSLDPNKGLEEHLKTMMEAIIKDNGGIMSVTYQFTAVNNTNEPYLVGYYRNFDQTTQDIMNSLDQNEPVIIGITNTDTYGNTKGRINMGHEITVVGYERDKRSGQILFKLFDSDDDVPKIILKPASEIVPQIHHAGFPTTIAKGIWDQINAKLNDQYLIPGPTDGNSYKLVPILPPNKHEAFLAEYQQMLQEEEAAVTAAQQPEVAAPTPPPAIQPSLVQQRQPAQAQAIYYPGAYYRPQQQPSYNSYAQYQQQPRGQYPYTMAL